jgi:hypothetical protein
MSAKHRSKFAVLSLVVMVSDSRKTACAAIENKSALENFSTERYFIPLLILQVQTIFIIDAP